MAFQGLSRDVSAKKRAMANAESSVFVIGDRVLVSAGLVREPLEPFVAAVDRVRWCDGKAW